ncbi:MAG: lysozyme [Candidatus Liberibacter europaeus]|uniref:Lysozyme n=1 Tax=Candidatus Liberibacter europaeus TaxID=744859 RepID=A0A2T4VWT2_9HYPH|nr:MAG: lysozyme [Candidatus Liberibacter europaeus]
MITFPSLLITLIKHFDGLSLKTYRYPAVVRSIGYGHTGFDVCENMQISKD